MFKKLALASVITLALANTSFASYTKVDCSTSDLYSQYSCNECFDWWEIKSWETVSFLDDVWKNDSTNSKLMYGEEVSYPKMHSFSWASFEQKPSVDTDFWELTSDLEALKDANYDWYVLPAWKEVTWIRSKMWSAYWFQNTALNPWDKAWILVFDIMSHNVLDWGEIGMNDAPHKECVLFANASNVEAPTPVEEPTPQPEPEQMTKVETWPAEFFLVLIVAMLAWIALLNRKVILEKIRN